MKRIIAMILGSIALLTGCETPHQNRSNPASYTYHRVVVDPTICHKCDYDNDIYQCNNIARHETNYAGNAIGGAAVGAATGAIFGAILGIDPGLMAGAGAAGGGIGGLGREAMTVQQMVGRCMQGRGYSVLR